MAQKKKLTSKERQARVSQGQKFAWERRKNVKDHVVRCGNHWLQTDDHLTDPKWVDLAQATLHTKEWADNFAKLQLKLNTRCEVLLATQAIENEREHGLRQVKTRWLYAFEALVRHSYIGFTSEGLWVNAHSYQGQGLTVQEAAEDFGKSLKLEKRLV